jgi:hypothetical protein
MVILNKVFSTDRESNTISLINKDLLVYTETDKRYKENYKITIVPISVLSNQDTTMVMVS